MPSSMAAFARPVRSVLNSRCSASIAPCMRCWTSLITSLIMFASLRCFVRNNRPHVLPQQGPLDVPLLLHREDVDRDRTVAREIDRGSVHNLQAVGEDALIGDVRQALRVRILFRVGGVNAVDL